MSYYEDERRRHRPSRRRDDYEEAAYNARDNVKQQTSLVRRARDNSVSSVEEIQRDFPPGDRGGYYRETTVRKSGRRPARARSYDEDRYFDDRYDGGSHHGGARRADTYVAAGHKRGSRAYEDRHDHRSRRHDSSSSRSRTPPKKDRRKSMPEEALEALGLGGLAGALLGKSKDRSRSRDRDRDRSRSRARGRDRSSSSDRTRGKNRSQVRKEQLTAALKAAVLAGAGEAFRARNQPGSWGGEKGKRVLTAAFSGGGVGGLIADPHVNDGSRKRDTLGSAVAGIAASRVVHGSRSKSRGRGGSGSRERGRSESRGGLKDLLAGGLTLGAAKKAYDNVRSRSRGRGRSRSSSSHSSDSRGPPRAKSRTRSLSRVAARGLAAVGLKEVAEKMDPERRQSRRYSDDSYDDRYDRYGHHGGGGGYGHGGYGDPRDDVGQPRSESAYGEGGRPRSIGAGRVGTTGDGALVGPASGYPLRFGPHHPGDPDTDSSSDLGSSSDEERDIKKQRRKQMFSAGLATVATIHASRGVYQSWQKRKVRNKALQMGDMSEAQAKANTNRDRLQNVASIGLAALGVKGAYDGWKGIHEDSGRLKEEKEKIERHRAKREARRRKLTALEEQGYWGDGHANSMPNLATSSQGPFPVYYTDGSPYTATGAAAQYYYDDNPYGEVPGQGQGQTEGRLPAPPPPPPPQQQTSTPR